MSHTITFKLNKPAQQFSGGDSTGFGIKGGVKYYDRDTKADAWTNYECAVFAKAQGQIDYYTNNLIEGAVVTVTAKTLKLRSFETKQGVGLVAVLNDAYIEYIASPAIVRDPQAAQSRMNNAQAPHQSAPAGFDDFDQDIPF
jgi:single-strand DNA-binding protein